MTDLIRVRGVQVRARHGVLPAEREAEQPFVVDLEVGCDVSAAAETDDLGKTLSYAWLAERAAEVLAGPPVNLIESLAARIADAVIMQELAEFVQVTVHKPEAPMPVAYADAAVTVRRERDRDVVVALGSNLGDRALTLAAALADLGALEGVRVRACSALVETAPVGPPQPDYLNAVALIATRLHPSTLLRAMHTIEARHGRRRSPSVEPNGPRVLDLDLIQAGDPVAGTDVTGRYGDLELPHPRAAGRAFVLAPWLDVAPSATLRTPEGVREVGALLRALPAAARAGVRPGPAWPAGRFGRGGASMPSGVTSW